MKLQYVGRMLLDGPQNDEANPRLWNLILPGHPSHKSTLGIQSLRNLGLLKAGL